MTCLKVSKVPFPYWSWNEEKNLDYDELEMVQGGLQITLYHIVKRFAGFFLTNMIKYTDNNQKCKGMHRRFPGNFRLRCNGLWDHRFGTRSKVS